MSNTIKINYGGKIVVINLDAAEIIPQTHATGKESNITKIIQSDRPVAEKVKEIEKLNK